MPLYDARAVGFSPTPTECVGVRLCETDCLGNGAGLTANAATVSVAASLRQTLPNAGD